MKMSYLILTAFVVATINAQAQQEVDINNIPVELQNEAAQNNNGQLRRTAQNDPNVVTIEEEERVAPSQGVVILNTNTNENSARARANQVLQQPTTYVQASPLTDSRAEQLRQARQAAEVSTEQKIVEKLETSRLEDERDRAERLFGNRWESQQQSQQVNQAQGQIYGNVDQKTNNVQVDVVRVDEDDREKEDLASIKEEIIAAVKESQEESTLKMTPVIPVEPAKKHNKYFVGASLGMAEYDASNVQNNGAGGFTVGTYVDNGIIIEASFLYSNYYLDQWWSYDFFKEIDQYNYSLSAKYSPLTGSFKPFIGSKISYTYRKYADRSNDNCCGSSSAGYRRYNQGGYGEYEDLSEVTSNAVDYGFLIGLDVLVTDSFALGAEYQYTMNMFHKSDNDFLDRGDFRAPGNSKPLEEVDYSVILFSGKFTF